MANHLMQAPRYRWLLLYFVIPIAIITGVGGIAYGIVNVNYDDRRADQINDRNQATVRGEFWAYVMGRKEIPPNPKDQIKLAADLKPLMGMIDKGDGLKSSRLPREITEAVAAPKQYGNAPGILDFSVFGTNADGSYYTEGAFSDEFTITLIDVANRPSDYIQQARSISVTYASNPIIPWSTLLVIYLAISPVVFLVAIGCERAHTRRRNNLFATNCALEWHNAPYVRPPAKAVLVLAVPHVFVAAAAIHHPKSLLIHRQIWAFWLRILHGAKQFRISGQQNRRMPAFEHPYPEKLAAAKRLYAEAEMLHKKHGLKETEAARDAALQVLTEYHNIPLIHARDTARVTATRMVREAVDLRIEPQTWAESQQALMEEHHEPEIAELRKVIEDLRKDAPKEKVIPSIQPVHPATDVLDHAEFQRMVDGSFLGPDSQ